MGRAGGGRCFFLVSAGYDEGDRSDGGDYENEFFHRLSFGVRRLRLFNLMPGGKSLIQFTC